MTLEEFIRDKKDKYIACLEIAKDNKNYFPSTNKKASEQAQKLNEYIHYLECLQEIAHIFLEHREWGEYPSSADDMWKETIRVLDKYKIEIIERNNNG